MNKKQLKNLFLFFLLSAFLLAGCAHKSAAPFRAAQTGEIHNQNQQGTTGSPNQIQEDSVKGIDSDDDFSNDEFDDEFEGEFEEDKVQVADPFSLWNRAMFHFNDRLYFWVIKPLARGYKTVTPDFFRTGVKNFFHNITTPVRMVNCILQAKGDAAVREFSRFIINSTIGVLGFGSPADKYPEFASPDEEDLGQTLARYGIGNGFYIVWPILGPSTLRDTIGMAGDFYLNPVNYVEPAEASMGIKGFDKINATSFRIGDYESFKKAAIDPYLAFREAYLQFREKKVEE